MSNAPILLCLAVFVVPAVAKNLIINPGFDETPWDTGWAWGGGSYEGISIATPDTNRYYTSPQSCKLQAQTSWYDAYIYLYQEILPATSCTCRVYFQNRSYNSSYAWTEYHIYVKINNGYHTEWVSEGDNPVWTKWEKIYGSSDTLSSIEFSAIAMSQLHGANADANFWIDDVCVSGTVVGIEEDLSNINEFLEIYPNPFTTEVIICYSLYKEECIYTNNDLRIKIYDLSGRLVRSFSITQLPNDPMTRVVWDGRDRQGNEVMSGVYFVRLEASSGKSLYPGKKLVKF